MIPSRENAASLATAIGFGAVVALSCMEQSAAGTLAWPWCGAYLGAALLPWGVLVGFGLIGGLRLSRAFLLFALPGAIGMVVAWAVSPYRTQTGVWLLWPLAGVAWAIVVGQITAGTRHRGMPFALPLLVGAAGLLLSGVSLLDWVVDQLARLDSWWENGFALPHDVGGWLAWWFAARNHQPLGHVNYTGGVPLLFLPWLCWLALTLWRRDGDIAVADAAKRAEKKSDLPGRVFSPRFCWWLAVLGTTAAALCLLMLLSSGSRGAWLASVVMLVCCAVLVVRSRPEWRRRLAGATAVLVFVAALLAVVHPALRSSLRPRSPSEIPNTSNAERRSMLAVGWRMGLDRPIMGWGIGAVPLAYDRYRGAEVYGPVNMLQVHSTPVQLWAEGGLVLTLTAVGLLAVALQSWWRRSHSSCPGFLHSPVFPAGLSLCGYAAFAVTDYQLDLPIVALMVATNGGVLLAAETRPVAGRWRWVSTGGAVAVLAFLCVITIPWVLGRRDLAQGAVDRAIVRLPNDATLRATRGLLHAAAARATVDQILRVQLESAAEADLAAALDHGAPLAFVHFNLGWLLLEQRPADAQAHFEQTLAVSTAYPQAWLGCALSSVALGNTKAAVEALAMETLAHPDFLYSGWWSHPSLQPLRGETLARVESALAELSVGLTAGQWPEPQARYLQAVVGWLRGTRPAAAVAQCALDATQREFWRQADDPAAPPSLLLSADWRAQPAVRQRLRSHVERAGGILAGARVVQDMALLETARTPAEALRLLWLARPTERPLPRLTAYPSSAGFGVRQRNPYAQRAPQCSPVWHNLLAECFTPALLPPSGWLYEDRLRRLAARP